MLFLLLKFSVKFFTNFALTLLSLLFVELMRKHIELSMKFSLLLQKAFIIHSISFLAFSNNLCFHVNSLFQSIFLIRFGDAHFDQLLMFFWFYTHFMHVLVLTFSYRERRKYLVTLLYFLFRSLDSCFGCPEPY